jgi:hypothetical protein
MGRRLRSWSDSDRDANKDKVNLPLRLSTAPWRLIEEAEANNHTFQTMALHVDEIHVPAAFNYERI